ncbi:MAG: DUF2093 domain-containing protein [Pontixanthobacter sp.]
MLMSSSNKTATLAFGPNGFRVVKSGDHVLCAVTAAEIPLEELRYWNVDRQESYASAEIATRRFLDAS